MGNLIDLVVLPLQAAFGEPLSAEIRMRSSKNWSLEASVEVVFVLVGPICFLWLR